MNHQASHRGIPRPGAACGAALVLLLALAGSAGAQSSATRALSPGVMSGGGGTSSSAAFSVVGEIASTGGLSRTSGVGFDAVPGLVGGAFTSRATVTISMVGNAYKAIAFPVNDANNAPAAVLSELGSVNNREWRLGHFSPADNAYQEPGTSLNLTTLSQGLGYWLVTASSRNIASSGLPAPTRNFSLVLTGPANSWHQIGNPFLFPVAVNTISVTDGITSRLVTDGLNTFTEQVIKQGDGPPYSNATSLNGRTGFFIRKLIAGPVTIIYPFRASATGLPEPALAKPEGAEWAFGVAPWQGGREGEPIVVGAAAVKAGGWNRMNLSLAPAPPGAEPLQLRLPRSDLGVLNGDFVRDFQPLTDRMTWEFVLDADQTPSGAELRFHGFDLPSGVKFFLTDLVSGWTREVSAGENLPVATASGGRRFRLEALGANLPRPRTVTADAFRLAYPNPFGRQVGLNFALVRGGDISVEIFDVQGRLLRSIERRGLPAGEHVLVWDGRDFGGRATGSGVFLTRWRAGSIHGTGRLVRVD